MNSKFHESSKTLLFVRAHIVSLLKVPKTNGSFEAEGGWRTTGQGTCQHTEDGFRSGGGRVSKAGFPRAPRRTMRRRGCQKTYRDNCKGFSDHDKNVKQVDNIKLDDRLQAGCQEWLSGGRKMGHVLLCWVKEVQQQWLLAE